MSPVSNPSPAIVISSPDAAEGGTTTLSRVNTNATKRCWLITVVKPDRVTDTSYSPPAFTGISILIP
jgi:hypothetical protein